jgi:hypothetical protein
MPVLPNRIQIDPSGAIARIEPAARDVLKAGPGTYRVVGADGLLFLILDEGTGTAQEEGESFALAGDVKHTPLLSLMNNLGQSRETGRLVVKNGETERVILLKAGDVASVGSNLARDRLGNFLVRLGRVTESDLEKAQKICQQTGQRIGQVLVQQKLVQPHELWGCIQEQITELFAEVTQWTTGSFVLYRVPENQAFPSTPPLSMQGLLLEAVRRADEMSVFRERIPNVNAPLRRTQKQAPAEMEPDEAAALEKVGVETSVAEVAKNLRINEFEATRLCYQLLKAGLIEIGRAASTAPETAPPMFVLRPEDKERLEVYNLAFREIKDELTRAGHHAAFLDGVRRYLADPTGGWADLFRFVDVDETGALDVEPLIANLGDLVQQGFDATTTITEALNELTFFMLFQCGEVLDPKSDENLGRRVRLIHASLPPAAR